MNAIPSSAPRFTDNEPRTAGPILAVASGKGGVGKTVVATSLARAFSRAGERVLLVDADLGMANIDVQLGLNPPGDIASVVAGKMSLSEAIAPALGGAEKKGGFDVISGRSGSATLASLDLTSVNSLAAGLAAVSMSYDRTILDLAAGADRATIRLAVAADDVALVISDEPTSLTDAYAFVKTLRMRDEGASPFVVVNNTPDRATAEQAFATFARTCTSFLGFTPPLAGIVRRDPNVGLAIRAQRPVGLRSPTSAAAKDIDALAWSLAEGLHAPAG
ncbi:site-determining protein [Marinicauda pacifica]|jgi:flagellar biosynthesis protein FlhG|uniref:MinD/ParA family protein n=2 Tax=Marinicauda pacifica TaxID=1133559 RepID=A0A4S2HD92_9PROT|nr:MULTISPECIES: AAA family ATPase [Marinicauda]TGY93718.1 MinD/ParA family protein [Marinicauda pacifica]GGE29734.1 site-determining protein [Marinicauda pacifica]